MSLRGKTCLVTGASSGIGLEIARGLAAAGGRVVIACRDLGRGERARVEIARTTRNERIELIEVDLASQRSIRRFAGEVKRRYDALHRLVNNAAVLTKRRETSPDGIELTWATNVLGYHLTTRLLSELLEASAPARIVNVASCMAEGLDLDDIEWRRRRFDGPKAYAQSKQADRMLTWALARRLAGRGVTANAVHPGCVASGITRHHGFGGRLVWLSYKAFGRSAAAGADTAVHVAASPMLERVTGRYYVDRCDEPCPHARSRLNDELWEICERMTARSAPRSEDESPARLHAM